MPCSELVPEMPAPYAATTRNIRGSQPDCKSCSIREPRPLADISLDTSNTVFLCVRHLDGTVRRVITCDPVILRSTPVPSLGSIVDHMLQSFGYDATSCYYLWHTYTHAGGYYDFCYELVSQSVPLSEVAWYWNNIAVTGGYRNHTEWA